MGHVDPWEESSGEESASEDSLLSTGNSEGGIRSTLLGVTSLNAGSSSASSRPEALCKQQVLERSKVFGTLQRYTSGDRETDHRLSIGTDVLSSVALPRRAESRPVHLRNVEGQSLQGQSAVSTQDLHQYQLASSPSITVAAVNGWTAFTNQGRQVSRPAPGRRSISLGGWPGSHGDSSGESRYPILYDQRLRT